MSRKKLPGQKLSASILGALLLMFNISSLAGAETPLSLKVLNYESFGGADLQGYMIRMKEVIRSRWHPASEPAHPTKIFFQVFADGSLLQHAIEESSGDTAFDDQAKSIIEGCAPFGAPPPGSVRLMNIVATFGAAGAPGSSGGSGNANSSGGGGGSGSPRTANGASSADTSRAPSGVQSSAPLADSNTSSETNSKPPLQGEATASGLASSATSSQNAPRLLTGEVGASGQYATQPMYQAQAMAQAPPVYPMYQAQAQMQAPPMFQAQTASQAPFQGMVGQTPLYQSSVQHGQSTVGVLGCEFGMLNNQIRQILPGSDLLRYGFAPGDIIEAADGQQLHGKAMQAYVRGTPGTYIQLSILHQGRLVTVPVLRKDAREFSNFSGYFRKWAASEKFW